MHSKNDFNIENYIKALSTYIPASSMVKLKKAYKAFTFTKHPKSTILENRQLNDSFCILICGTIRHYTIDSNTAEEHYDSPSQAIYCVNMEPLQKQQNI